MRTITKEKELKFKKKVERAIDKIYPRDMEVTDKIISDITIISLELLSKREVVEGYNPMCVGNLIIYPYDIENGYIININHNLDDNSIVYGLSSKNNILKVG